MRTKVQKWGNSLAIRIPKAFAEELAMNHGTEVDLSLEAGELIMKTRYPGNRSLLELLEKVTDANIHGEVSTGERVSQEVW